MVVTIGRPYWSQPSLLAEEATRCDQSATVRSLRMASATSPARLTLVGGCIAAGIATGAAVVHVPGIIAFALPTALMLGLSIGSARVLASYADAPRLANRVSRWALGSFAAHFALGVVITASFRLTTLLGGDALLYHGWAQGIVAHWDFGVPLPADLPAGKSGFSYLLGGAYWAFGPYQVAGLAINAFFSSALVPLMTDTTKRLYGARAAHWVAPLVVLPVGFVLWPGQLLREAGVLFLMAVIINAAVRLQQGATKVSLLLTMALALGILVTFRSYIALTLAGGVIVGITLGRSGLGGLRLGGSAALLVIGLVVGGGLGYSGIQAIQETDLSTVNNVRMDSANGAASGFLTDADVSTGRNALSYLPLALPRFLLGPFPWEIRPGRQLLVLPDVLVWWALLPSLGRGFRRARKLEGSGLLILLLPAASITLALSLLIANYGTAVRSRMQVLLLLVPLMALGLAHRRRQAPAGSVEEAPTVSVLSGA